LKRGTTDHPKTHELAAVLGLEKWGAVGVLEALFHFTAQYARRGDIGRHTDAAIARGIGWSKEPAKLIGGLVQAGWLDRCRCHRLRVHDWHDHADQTVGRCEEVKRSGFIECYEDASALLVSDEHEASQPLPLPLPLPKPLPKPIAVPEASVAASRFVQSFNTCFTRRATLTPDLIRCFEARVRDGYSPEVLVGLPVLVDAQGLDREIRKDLHIGWLLRTGTGHYTRDGQTRPTKNWVEDAIQRADRTVLLPRHVEVALGVGCLSALKELGVQLREGIA